MFFCVFSQGATSSPPAVSAADSSAVHELAHSLKARVGMAAEMLDTGKNDGGKKYALLAMDYIASSNSCWPCPS